MSTETKKQSFIQEALSELCDCATRFGFDKAELKTFEDIAVMYLKESFKNGLNAGYRKAKGESKAKADGQSEKQ